MGKGLFTTVLSSKISLAGAAIAFLIVLFAYKLNNDPYNFSAYHAVIILFSSHGNIAFLGLTALAGCAFILLTSTATPPNVTLVWLGQNTLILMCLNGIFYQYINSHLAKWVLDGFGGSSITVTAAGLVTTIFSLLLCVPFVSLFNRFVPQLVGKPRLNNPLPGNK